MTKAQARYQALAASGGAVAIFIGLCHELVGLQLFPRAEAFVGGPIPWHSMGILCLLAGILLFVAALQLVRVPTWAVVTIGVVMAIAATAVMILTWMLHRQFHLFALALAVWGAVVAYSYPRSLDA